MNTILLSKHCTINQERLDFLSKYKLNVNEKHFDNKTMLKVNDNLILPRDNQDLNLILSLYSWNYYFEIKNLSEYIEKEYYDIVENPIGYETINIDYESKILYMNRERNIFYEKKDIYILCLENNGYEYDIYDGSKRRCSVPLSENLKSFLKKYQIHPWFFEFNSSIMIKIEGITLPRFNQELNSALFFGNESDNQLTVFKFSTVVDQKYIKFNKSNTDTRKGIETAFIDYNANISDLLNILGNQNLPTAITTPATTSKDNGYTIATLVIENEG